MTEDRDNEQSRTAMGQTTKEKGNISTTDLRTPQRSVLEVGVSGPHLLSPNLITAERIGLKALGLVALPSEWVPPFFVVNAECLDGSNSQFLEAWCMRALAQCGIEKKHLIVRSSGVAETLPNRGRLISDVCSMADLTATLSRLSSEVAAQGIAPVHWIVQEHIRTGRRGHLSNERHLSHERRDWVVEVELQDGRPGYTSPVAVRTWRDGTDNPNAELGCTSEPQISLQLKNVALWTVNLAKRMHFEWVWNGSRLWIVQADVAELGPGVHPGSLLPQEIPEIKLESLSVFQPASVEHFERYAKLRNAKLYSDLDYIMPTFYVIDDQAIIKQILRGRVPPQLDRDLTELTKRPLIIRTDGAEIPTEQREMLPRSDELRSLAEAKSWLELEFIRRISESRLESSALCLIAHHFVPSVASAWARAEPAKRMVRIESLWGLPEGLYWYSHDTFEIDTETGNLTRRLRYKGTFIGADTAGRWVPHRTLAPYDWRRSIKHTKWIHEVATTTRKIADWEGYPVAVMWLIDNDKRATEHAVLPWFHSKSELSELPKAAPRRKLTTARDHKIQLRSDWEDLKNLVRAGKRIERVIVEPSDTELIRNPQFAEELATVAAAHHIVVELAGGILSHAYYVLRRGGVQVECVDLFGADEEVAEFHKLVRDKVPAAIERRGERVEVVQLTGDALLAALRHKLVEEAYEALDAKAGDELISELADIQEMVRAISDALQVPFRQVEDERVDKRARKGGFDRGMMLTKTSSPHSLAAAKESEEDSTLSLASGRIMLKPVVVQASDIPISAPYRRPDLRMVGQQPEKIFAFETELNKSPNDKQTSTFAMPIDQHTSREFTLSIEFSRSRAMLRGTVRLRLEPTQLVIELDDQLELNFRN